MTLDGKTTDDGFLNGRLAILQPRNGYRAAIDPVLLAAAVEARAGQRVLDLGCGVGTAGLCLLARRPDLQVVGLDVQPALVDLAQKNAARNDLGDQYTAICGDALARRGAARLDLGRAFDCVMTNPPYLDPKRANAPADPMKAVANVESAGGVQAWLDAALRFLTPKGEVVLIHRADRLADLLVALGGRVGGVKIYPLWPGNDEAARRVIVTATKGSAAPLSLLPGLILHKRSGGFTDDAERVLRDGKGLP